MRRPGEESVKFKPPEIFFFFFYGSPSAILRPQSRGACEKNQKPAHSHFARLDFISVHTQADGGTDESGISQHPATGGILIL